MNIEFAARGGLNPSDALKERVELKLQKIERRFGQSLFVRVKFDEVANGRYGCGINFNVSGHEYVAQSEGDDLFKAADEALQKIETQVRRSQSKHDGHRGDTIRGEAR